MQRPVEKIKNALREIGFDCVGVTTADPLPEDLARFESWLEAGHCGEMDYLAKEPRARADPRSLLPGARSVIAVAAAYGPKAANTGPIAAFAFYPDYHDRFRAALAKGAALVERIDPGARCRVAVDASPVLERALARRAGLGWIGCSTNLIVPSFGPFVLLGLLVTTARLEPDRPTAGGSCHTCGACVENCPTGALNAPGKLDATGCISYLTIEKKGPLSAWESTAIQGWVFGCDLCTQSCVQGLGIPLSDGSPLLMPRSDLAEADLLDLLNLCEGGFKKAFRGTPLFRTGKNRLIRNILYAARNLDLPWISSRARPYVDADHPALREAARQVLLRE